ncbi:Peptidase family M23 [Arthrobacter subterraneus]|uniref:Peptidase family M23 n=1 Tax=Arthrobacter subterraneus TaxID=335973 RepID=A0A1G8NNV6_9MICC|nr:M23 family metallopeptidase [Arthrobacter subterraneus]SDI81893.1 Peptidase family M23 [Arthrobacter subterraneus]
MVLGAAGLLSGVILPAQGSASMEPAIQARPTPPKQVTADPEAEVTFSRSAVAAVPASGSGTVDSPMLAAGSVENETREPTAEAPIEEDSEPVVGARFTAPLGSMATTSSFGYRLSPLTGAGELHTGLDLVASCTTEVLAAQGGTVVEAGWSPYGGGNRIVIDHGNGLKTTYNHLSVITVSTGQAVGQGEMIANAGTTGNSTGCHLHFEVMINDTVVDPTQWL